MTYPPKSDPNSYINCDLNIKVLHYEMTIEAFY